MATNTPTKNLYLEFSEPVDEQAVKNLLEQAGMKPVSSRTVTENNDGYILTQLLAAGIWEQETDQQNCPGPCPEKQKHLAWAELTQEQQHTFLKGYAGFLTSCSEEELLLSELLQDCGAFEGVALTRHKE